MIFKIDVGPNFTVDDSWEKEIFERKEGGRLLCARAALVVKGWGHHGAITGPPRGLSSGPCADFSQAAPSMVGLGRPTRVGGMAYAFFSRPCLLQRDPLCGPLW